MPSLVFYEVDTRLVIVEINQGPRDLPSCTPPAPLNTGIAKEAKSQVSELQTHLNFLTP